MVLFRSRVTLFPSLLMTLCLLAPAWVAAQSGSLTRIPASPDSLAASQGAGELIIDIRTEAEWEDTGVVSGAVPLQFFDNWGRYDAEAFIDSVTALAPPGTRIGIICRTANRSGPVSELMAEQGWQVTDYQGGMVALDHHGYRTIPLSQALADLDGSGYCDTPLAAC
ncbi:MAG: hypothetical protein LAT62_00040 [Natronospirillum sp.]|uniref:rhodanese-like domain-containing protein n=1 Tax=Natronospirillum sp. TaxID=2812955 RepID=UPI0025D13D35|nr:rhodanese-like domain-containing protein [Natronospirillum sp.]MCH8550289.1 hypothetical protein [Natronospirillum sp.]